MERKIAFLVFNAWREPRRKNKSFDGVSNIGAYMLMDVAERAGIKIGFCSVDTADQFDIVLVSMTSIYDCLSFYKQVRRSSIWQKPRRFRVLCGGFGLQNPMALLDYVDSFWFGRCEDEFVDWLTIDDFEHPSLMRSDNVKVCKINQAKCLYPHEFQLHTSQKQNNSFTESIMGCPNGCFFCHFSWARKHIKTPEHYNLSLYRGTKSQEIDMFNIGELRDNNTRITIGLDGMSERLRYSVNKHISNDLVVETLEKISRISISDNVKVTLYNIDGLEGQTNDDLAELAETINRTDIKGKRLIVNSHFTPFHPSCATPSVYAACTLKTRMADFRGSHFPGTIDTDKKTCVVSMFTASNFSLAESLVIERFTEKYRNLLDLICFNSKFNNLKDAQKIDYLERHYDLADLVREYRTDEQVPSWMCESYVGWDKIRKMREFMIEKQKKLGLRS